MFTAYCHICVFVSQTIRPKDELESLWYVLGELLEGELPWREINKVIPVSLLYFHFSFCRHTQLINLINLIDLTIHPRNLLFNDSNEKG